MYDEKSEKSDFSSPITSCSIALIQVNLFSHKAPGNNLPFVSAYLCYLSKGILALNKLMHFFSALHFIFFSSQKRLN